MSICIIGKSNSGKTTVQKILIEKYGYKPVILATTRPQRTKEVDHEDYHFISDDEFTDLLNKGEFLESQAYYTKQGLWKYGSFKEDYKGDNKVVILPFEQYIKIKDKIEFTAIYLNATDSVLLKRALRRDLKHPFELWRRFKADKKDFDEEDIFKNVYHSINVDDRSPEEIADIAKGMDVSNATWSKL